MVKHVERNFAGRALKLEAGRLAKQAAGSCLVQFGETVVLAAVTVSDNVSTLPFFPLTVEYREKAYAAGKIPGGFLKREGRPQDEEILAARVIDRSVRPLFPEGFKNEVQVFVYVLSEVPEKQADVLGRPVGTGGTRLDPESHLPAARVLRRGHGGVRLEGFDRDGGGRGARAHGGRDREVPRGGAQGHPRAARCRERAGRRHAPTQNGMDQGRAPGGAGSASEAARGGPGVRGAQPAGEVRAGAGARGLEGHDPGRAGA